MRRRGASALLAAWLSSVAGDASAFCRTKACDNRPAYDDVWQVEPDPPCTRDPVGCQLEGLPLFWPATCISYAVQKDGSMSDGIDFELATSIIEQSFAAWQEADCGGAPPSLVVKNLGAVSCDRREYNQSQPNANVFMFRDDSWPYDDVDATIAFTTLTYNTETGEIYNVDVEVNSFDERLSVTDDPAPGETDLLSVMTHEVGHFLGLSHSRDKAATMWPEYTSPETGMRTLEQDDVLGICEIYPPGRRVGASCEPRHGFSRVCASADEGGCSITTAREHGAGLGTWLPAGAALWLTRRALRGALSSKRPARRR
jgi:hypothetical protein